MKILTPSGFQSFDGVSLFDHDKSLRIKFDESDIDCALQHKFVTDESREVYAENLKIGDIIGGKCVRAIDIISGQINLYSPINVRNGSVYYHDDFIPSTQTFFGTGDTLINAETLMQFRSTEPIRRLENYCLNIYKETVKGHDYIMTVDVSKGRGQDYSTFNVIDISVSPFEQVAVYRNNVMSPILFPNIIYKYAKIYNEAYVVIESNDQGGVVCNGLYHDLEYENMHVESAIKANALGVEMTRKVKRLGCSAIKDVLENHKLKIVDEDTILEISTFEARGHSYEASNGNHDDLMMNLVMFGFFVSTQYFNDMTNIDLKKMLFDQRMQEIDNDLVPFGFIDDGSDHIAQIETPRGTEWAVDYDPNL